LSTPAQHGRVGGSSINRLIEAKEHHLLWQPCRCASAWLSHLLRQGVLNVAGQIRLHDAF
jgi:hypothetical protein